MGNDFIWRELSEKDKEEIKKNAKEILEDFSGKLSGIDLSKIKDSGIDREIFEREENSGKVFDIDREIMFENAPEKNKDFVIGEKKKW